jgi:hypothetical protein
MRTTVNLDPEVLQAAKRIATARSLSLGAVISDLVRKGLASPARVKVRSGFPVFGVTDDAAPIALDDVKRDEDEI